MSETRTPAPEAAPSRRPDDAAQEPGRFTRALQQALIGGPIVVTLLAFVLALVLGAVLLAFSEPDVLHKYSYFFAQPGDALSATWDIISSSYSGLFRGAIFDPSTVSAAADGTADWTDVLRPLSESLLQATPLIAAGLAVALPFRAGLFNIGGNGQLIIGALLGGYVGFAWHLPPVLHVLVAVFAAMLGGALWGAIAGFLKARTGAHEVITTIMLNYIATYLLSYLLTTSPFRRPGRIDPISPVVDADAQLRPLFGEASGLRVHTGLLAAIAAAAFVAWLLKRSTLGFQFRAVGSNAHAARTAGMSVPRAYLLVMVIAGGLAGLAGASQALGTNRYLSDGIAAGIGFDAITVALLGRNRPWGVVLAGLLFGALRAGAVQMQASTGTPIDIVTVIQSLIVMFIAAPPLIRAIFRLRTPAEGLGGQTLAKGWNG